MCERRRLLSYWLACSFSWHLDTFVAGWRLGEYISGFSVVVLVLVSGIMLSIAWLVGAVVVVKLCERGRLV